MISKLFEPTKKGTYAYQLANTRLELYIKITFIIDLIFNMIIKDKTTINVINIIYLSIIILALSIGVHESIALRKKTDSVHLKHIYQFIFLALIFLLVGAYIV